MTTPWDLIVGPILKIVDKIIPDPQAKAEAQLKILQMQQAGEFKEIETDLAMAQGQMDINKIEAASESFWKSGWRPGVGWVGVVSLAAVYVPKAIFLSGMWLYQAFVITHAWDGGIPAPILPPYPDLGLTDLLGLLGSILGVGSMRSWDKKNGV